MFAHPDLSQDFEHAKGFVAGGSDARSHLVRLVDSTVLKPETPASRIVALCEEALRYGFRSVCVPPCHVALARKSLGGSDKVLVCTVVGFPNGNNTTDVKAFETANAVANGADEIDYVQNDGWVKDKAWDLLEAEARAIVTAARGKLVKIILETSLLAPDEIRECAVRSARGGVHVIKTSTGFGSRGASSEDISIIAEALATVERDTGRRHGIKASGGVRSTSDAQKLVGLGATRLGTSGGAAIADGVEHKGGY